MALDKALLARRFGRAAPGYGRHARVQAQAAAALVRAVVRRTAGDRPAQVLDVGCGTGLLTVRLLDALPGAEVVALDLSAGMLAEARRRLAGRAVRFALGDVEAGLPEGRFDLVASSMALQWLPDPASVLRRAALRLGAEGVLAAAVPVEGTLPELRQAYGGAAAALALPAWRYPGLAFHAAERWEGWARAAFEEVELEVLQVVERHPGARAVLASIRGVGGNDCEGGAGPAAVRLLRRALALYDARAGGEGVPATWRIAVVTARGARRDPWG
jgi:malonyl-CoA O-methyltransferase